MIVREKPGLLGLFFVLKGSIVQRIWPQLLAVAVLSTAVVAGHRIAPDLVPGASQAPFALIGIALSVFLSFRNSASYDRWWEARKLWGLIIQTVRDVTRQTLILDPAGGPVSEERQRILKLLILFARALVAQLRGLPPPAGASGRNPADRVLRDIAGEVTDLNREGRLSDIQAAMLHESIVRLSAAAAGCERLANTPLPFAYTLLLHRTAYIFCFILPFGFADALGWGTPLGVAVVAYAFFGLDALGDELEEPFGLLPHSLPLTAYATGIEITVREALDDPDLPAAPQPRDYVLS